MLDMRGIEEFDAYIEAKEVFKSKFEANKECHEVTECDWGDFKKAFLKFSKCKCPICEVALDNYDDIDHYRPKGTYPFAKCCCNNYMIMCSECNRRYKHAHFPLADVNTKALTHDMIEQENPLLINPRVDNVLEYFALLFVLRPNGQKVLELIPKQGLNNEKQQKAEKTIELYGLGDCSNTPKIDDCRLNVLSTHFERFIKLAKAKIISLEVYETLKADPDLPKTEEYGFIKFIDNDQFILAV